MPDKPKLPGIHNDFHAEVTSALTAIANRYGCSLRGVGIAPQDRSLVIIARFSEPQSQHDQ